MSRHFRAATGSMCVGIPTRGPSRRSLGRWTAALLVVAGIGLFLALIPRTSDAHPEPLPEEQLAERAEVIIDAVCLDIICGERVRSDLGETLFYLSTLEVTATHKGEPESPFQILGNYTRFDDGEIHPGDPFPVAKGWAGRMYLAKKEDGTWAEVWWNGRIEDAEASDPEPLPVCAPVVPGTEGLELVRVEPPQVEPEPLEEELEGGAEDDASERLDHEDVATASDAPAAQDTGRDVGSLEVDEPEPPWLEEPTEDAGACGCRSVSSSRQGTLCGGMMLLAFLLGSLGARRRMSPISPTLRSERSAVADKTSILRRPPLR